MKTNSILLIVILLTVGFSALSQETPQKIKRISIHDVYIQAGTYNENNPGTTLADFKTLIPQSSVFGIGSADYSSSSVYYDGGDNSSFSAMLGIRFSDKNRTQLRKNPLLRLGISYFSGTALSGNLFKEERKTYENFTSAQTGQQFYIDSVTLKRYSINYTLSQLRFDGSLIFRTNTEARWSLYGGIGFTAGFSLNSHTDIYYSKNDWTQIRDVNGNRYNSFNKTESDSKVIEKFRNKINVGASTYLPIGVDFRLGKKIELLKLIHLFYEFRPGINVVSIPELRTLTSTNLQHGIGLRISWN